MPRHDSHLIRTSRALTKGPAQGRRREAHCLARAEGWVSVASPLSLSGRRNPYLLDRKCPLGCVKHRAPSYVVSHLTELVSCASCVQSSVSCPDRPTSSRPYRALHPCNTLLYQRKSASVHAFARGSGARSRPTNKNRLQHFVRNISHAKMPSPIHCHHQQLPGSQAARRSRAAHLPRLLRRSARRLRIACPLRSILPWLAQRAASKE